ncbi:MAG: carboxypeptidase-like regulatory domain-containing protein [Patescibacteria group bacterium]
MEARRKKLTATFVAITAVLAFLIISSAAVVWANGLRFNSTTGSFEQTVLIAIDGSPQYVDVLLDGKKIADHIPYRIRNLSPDNYVVELTKPGFQTWRQTFRLSKGQVGLITDPTLIAKEPLITTTPAPLAIKILEDIDFGLELVGGELRDGGELINRFSVKPLQAHRFNNYYLYQLGDELRIFLPTGSQDFLVYRSQDQVKLPLALYPPTWQLAIIDSGATKFINLTISSGNLD